ncbi:MAG: hypothetical protein HYV28_01255 [Ignavibacteriales bacterium]|nr:hypothetical protein [Ignavibacteriales bacterium]
MFYKTKDCGNHLSKAGTVFLALSLLLLLCTLFSSNIYPQMIDEHGSPVIKHYTPKETGGTTQVWCAVQDKRGVLYFGDNSGILEFDGKSWKRIYNANHSVVRSLAIDSLGTIYVGGVNEFGYLWPNLRGELEYISLSQKLPLVDQRFQNVYSTMINTGGVYFLSPKCVYRYHKNVITKIAVDLSAFCAIAANNNVYLTHRSKGICLLKNMEYLPVEGLDDTSKVFRYGTSLPGNRLLVCNSKAEWRLYNEQTRKLEMFATPAQNYLEFHKVYFIRRIDELKFAVATKTGGIVILSNSGALLQIINKERGLPEGHPLLLFADSIGNLWSCTGNGIVRIDISFPVRIFDGNQNIHGSVLSSYTYMNRLYIGTMDGVFYLPEYKLNTQGDNHKFYELKSYKGSCWTLYEYKSVLFGMGLGGIWTIKDTVARKVIPFTATETVYSLSENKKFPDVLFIAVANELRYIKINKDPSAEKIEVLENYVFPEIHEKITTLVPDREGNLWVTTSYEGIYYIRFKDANIKNYQVTLLGKRNGLPALARNYAYLIDNEIFVATTAGVLGPEFPHSKGPDSLIQFSHTRTLGGIIHTPIIQVIKADSDKYLLFGDSVFSIKVRNSIPEKKIEGLGRLMSAFSINYLFYNDSKRIGCGAPGTYISYNNSSGRDFSKGFPVVIRKVTIGKDSLLFDGAYFQTRDTVRVLCSTQPPEFKPVIDANNNSIVIHYSGLFFEEPEEIEYQYKLEGFTDEWCQWTKENKAIYTSLSGGE